MNWYYIDKRFEEVAKEPTDMIGHMETLRAYATDRRVVEFGVYDCTSTWALLAGHPSWMRSYDIIRRDEVDEVERAAIGMDFKFVWCSSLQAEWDMADVLFIDSLHIYLHLLMELRMHAARVSQYIIIHDTELFRDVDQFGLKPGLGAAIDEFLAENKQWVLHETYTHCHGLTVLRHV